MRKLLPAILAIFLFTSLSALEPITTIVVIEGRAFLVDLDEQGQVVRTYMEVKDYFDSDKSQEEKLDEAVANYVMLSKQELDQIRFIALTDRESGLDNNAKSNLFDIYAHYLDTYANNIVITGAKNPLTDKQLEVTIQLIKEYLASLGANQRDVEVTYKIDLGDEPTEFVKVVSKLREITLAKAY